ncbi:PadR family transcriptional regulator [Leucobacter sp.]
MDTQSEKIATNLRKGVLEYCVLALLSQRDMYGLELANELMERALSASEGSLYPLLARMRESGTVDTRWEGAGDSGGSRPRRYYAITEYGRAQLERFAAVWGSLAHEVEALIETAADEQEKR